MKEFSFVQMENIADAEKALRDLTGTVVDGKTLNVEFSRTKKEKTNCFNCGRDGHWARSVAVCLFVS